MVIILRRLIMLMALSLTLDPAKPRTAKAAPTEEDPVLTKAQIPYSLALSGQTLVYMLEGPHPSEGAPRPFCPPMKTHRLKPELGAVAAGLPMLLAEAFGRWNDSS